MSLRLVHLPDGVCLTYDAPDASDPTLAVPDKPQRQRYRPGQFQPTRNLKRLAPRPRMECPAPGQRRPYAPVSLLDRAGDQCAWMRPDGLCCGARQAPNTRVSCCQAHDDISFGRMKAAE